jgi:phosphatidylglycerophosphatase C
VIAADPRDRTRVVACDVDGTLTRRDCVVPFLREVAGTRRLVGTLGRRPDRLTSALARRDRDTLKALAVRAAFAGRQEAEITALGERFAERVVAGWLRDDVVDRVRADAADGAVVVLVSASFEAYLRPLARMLELDDVLGVRLAATDGVLTGELQGWNTRGPEKVRRLERWLEEHHGGRRRVELIAYGDSAGDRELLAGAEVAHWVGRYRP